VHSVPGVSPSKEEEEVSPQERSELEAVSKAIGEYTQLAERFMSFLPQEFTGYVTVRKILDNYIDWSCEAYSDYYQKAANYQEALRGVKKSIDDYLSAFRIVSIGASTARADIVLEGLHQDAVKAIDSCLLELGQMRLFPYKKGHVNLDQVPQRSGSMFDVPVLVQKRTQLPDFLGRRPLPFLGRWEPNEIKQVQKPGLYLLCNFCRHVVRCTSQAWSEHQLEKTEKPVHRQIWPEMHCFIRRHQNVRLLEDELDPETCPYNEVQRIPWNQKHMIPRGVHFVRCDQPAPAPIRRTHEWKNMRKHLHNYHSSKIRDGVSEFYWSKKDGTTPRIYDRPAPKQWCLPIRDEDITTLTQAMDLEDKIEFAFGIKVEKQK